MTGLSLPLVSQESVQYKYFSDKPDRQLEDILYLTVGVELSNAGLSSTRENDKVSYLLNIRYKTDGKTANIAFQIARSAKPETVLAETTIETGVDYQFDAVVAASVKELLTKAGLDSASARSTEIKGLFAHSGAAEGMTLEEIAAAMAWRVETSVGAGGTVFFGKITDMFHYGATASLTAGLRIPRKSWSFEPGVRMTVTRVLNDSGVSGGTLYLSTAGINLQYGTGFQNAFRFSAAVSGGAAVLSVKHGSAFLNKTVPYTDAGVLICLPVGKQLFAGADIRYLVVFDQDYAIMGMVPTLSLSKEF